MSEEKKKLYLYLAAGTAGNIMVGLGILQYFIARQDADVYFLPLIGFALVTNYIYFLEKKAGVGKKVIWIQSGAAILIFGAALLFL
ncbi:hypothetical protein CEF21_03385 [Bacillus sp. FJAT-42376]|uniref:hypothetical protein n=1 Tax=Bacillus sp. FJAT-42376 TaxID=2014076 RepID=UPI000F4DE5D5|nr:hypothetical protein [Bacillus sp. FJAT-42376]AZB41420.1 hypothetical protein CEF21_03385 [Bacillus sp. FJAT-42376]